MLELRADLSQACKQLEEERALNRQKEAAVVERDGLRLRGAGWGFPLLKEAVLQSSVIQLTIMDLSLSCHLCMKLTSTASDSSKSDTHHNQLF